MTDSASQEFHWPSVCPLEPTQLLHIMRVAHFLPYNTLFQILRITHDIPALCSSLFILMKYFIVPLFHGTTVVGLLNGG